MKPRYLYICLSSFLFAYFFAQAMSISANFFAAMCAQPVYGFVSDKAGLNKTVLWTIAVLVLLCGFFFAFVYRPLLTTYTAAGAVAGGVYLGVTFIAGSFAIESYVDRAGRKYGFEFSRVRLWGSLGFAAAAFFSGSLFNIDPRINFFLASLAGLLMLLVLYLTPIQASEEEMQDCRRLRLTDALAVLQLPKFWSFMVLILGVTTLYLVYDLQFPAYFASQFPDPRQGTTMFGRLNSAQIFVEAGMFFLAPFIVDRTGAKNGLLLATAIMIIRIAGSGLVTGPLLISCMKMLHSLELPILIVSIFRYIAAHFETHLASTLYLVSTGFIRNIGMAVFSLIAGKSYDLIGFPRTYLAIAAFASVFWIASFFALSPTRARKPVWPRSPSPDVA